MYCNFQAVRLLVDYSAPELLLSRSPAEDGHPKSDHEDHAWCGTLDH